MFRDIKLLIALAAFLTLCLRSALSVSCIGCVDLDELSLNQTIRHFKYAIVNLDIAFPYGDKHMAYAELSRAAHRVNADDLLVATVGIKDYGEMENKVLGERYGYNEKNFPGILLFKAGNLQQPQIFPTYLEVTEENLKKFINDNTELYVGCEGCLKEFNLAIKNYAKFTTEEQLNIIKKLQEMEETLIKEDDKINAKVYVTFARKINTEGYQFVEVETQRLLRLRSSRVTEEKRAEILRKLHVLNMFRVGNLQQRKPKKAKKEL